MVAGISGDGYGLGQVAEGKARYCVGVEGNGSSVVAAFADALNNGDLTKQWYSKFIGQALATLLSKQVVLVLREFSWGEPGHILYKAQNGNVYLRFARSCQL